MATDTTSLQLEKIFTDAEDFLPLNGTDYVELYVGNAKQAAHFYKTAFGFQGVAYAGLETGVKDRTSYVLQQGKIRLVLTSPLGEGGEINAHINKHGDGVKNVALWVDDAVKSFNETTSRGAEVAFEPKVMEDANGKVTLSAIKTYGETVHVFVDRSQYDGPFLPGFKKWESHYQPTDVGLKYVDHMVGNVDWGEMNKWVEFYAKVMGFAQLVSFDDKDISTEYTALMSKVMTNGNGRIKFPINEPAEGKKKSQIEEYIDFYSGAGVQHIAVATDDIVKTVSAMKDRGVEFLYVPDTYYDDLLDRVGDIDEDVAILREHGILVDRDDEGYLLQLFTKPVSDRPTLFFEIIQRKGAQSFGKGNFKALFESIEREQESRGTL
ncbi:4-hydroxyphenylpyruvate dioxygenase [Phaeocystidibacter marisrubri]|uniref:4-hydroxyphenylpyruvate dioxygenase n=1 Tax=Phaeocystidibacter marisrubri TaxID=1577780 RepID=A0A6L3ZES9_9FLAO|nr:4-hydroxyphenylpyruvate dioxygenase [Phaeocystidibacter marisrubri]KAB2816200.1 4-hydroxyphenylpyruvate dioxygenase [Phaeocystidibacter marisrubri]GGH67820.1 4-hydroxyphenylpyruvate dioxygenase [Phaeocystidibacter marisrubri]